MKKLFRILNKVILFTLSVSAGSYLGAQARQQLTGQPSQGGIFRYTDEKGMNYTTVPMNTHMLPGFLLMAIGKPYWLMGLLGSFIASVLIGDTYEKIFLEQIGQRLVEIQAQSRPAGEGYDGEPSI
jgi:quinol-cytochrome oxidoreductase complex cytochrome b subunit